MNFTKTLRCSQGSALLYALFVSALLAIPLAALRAHTWRELQITKSMRGVLNIRARITDEIETLIADTDQNLLSNQLTKTVEQAPWPRLLLGQAGQLTPLQVVTLNQAGPFSKPAWSRLQTELSLENSNCSAGNANRYNAASTCNFSGTLSEPGIFSGGNLKSSADIEITNRNNAVIQIVVPGSVDLSHQLLVKDSENLRLEIIAVGEIKISDLKLDNSSGVELVLHSALDKISLSTASAVSLCGATDSGKPLSLRAHSLNSVKLNGTELLNGAPTVVGCQMQLDQETWPARTVIGKL